MPRRMFVIRIKHNNDIVKSFEVPIEELGPFQNAQEYWVLEAVITSDEQRVWTGPLAPWGEGY